MPTVEKPGKKIECKKLNLNIKDEKYTNFIDSNIHIALGDLQCSVYSCLEYDSDCGKYASFYILISYKKNKTLF